MKRFIIDLARCIGCDACKLACRDRANLPEGQDWLRIETHESGQYPNPRLEYRVVHCFHCAEAPCMPPCPVEAISRDKNGWVRIDSDACIGCGACAEACPFQSVVLLESGMASKCDGCADEVARGWDPTCVRACPMRALALCEDPANTSRVVDQAYEEHPAKPRVAYLRRS